MNCSWSCPRYFYPYYLQYKIVDDPHWKGVPPALESCDDYWNTICDWCYKSQCLQVKCVQHMLVLMKEAVPFESLIMMMVIFHSLLLLLSRLLSSLPPLVAARNHGFSGNFLFTHDQPQTMHFRFYCREAKQNKRYKAGKKSQAMSFSFSGGQ